MTSIEQTAFQSLLNTIDDNETNTTTTKQPVKKRVLFISCVVFMLFIFFMNVFELILSKINYKTFECVVKSFITNNKTDSHQAEKIS